MPLCWALSPCHWIQSSQNFSEVQFPPLKGRETEAYGLGDSLANLVLPFERDNEMKLLVEGSITLQMRSLRRRKLETLVYDVGLVRVSSQLPHLNSHLRLQIPSYGQVLSQV